MDLPLPQHSPVRPRHAQRRSRRDIAELKQAANTVANAIKSPRCMVRWEADDNGDMFAIWITEGCTNETSVNCSALKRRMDELVKQFGTDIMTSRKGNSVSVELPTLKG